jgi:hypothetical protein
MNANEYVITRSRWDRLRMTWLGIRIACAEFDISPFDPRIAWATICALWSALWSAL